MCVVGGGTHTHRGMVVETVFVASQFCKYTQFKQQREQFLCALIFLRISRVFCFFFGCRTSVVFIRRLLDSHLFSVYFSVGGSPNHFPLFLRIFIDFKFDRDSLMLELLLA